MKRSIFLFILAALLFSACGLPPASDSGTAVPVILTSTTFLADIARNVAGDRARVESLLPLGADPHTYQPTPLDVARIAESKVLILNGLEYEHFIESLLESAGGEQLIIVASEGIEPRKMEEHHGEENAAETEAGEGSEHEAGDPHMWLDPNLVLFYVENIREGLTHFDPHGAAIYQANAEAYRARLKELDAWIVEEVAQIPPERRLLITNHESLGYFAERYGFRIVGTVIESFSSDASPSAQQMATLIGQIRASGAPAIFLEASENPALAQQIADESGVRVVTGLHLESLTNGSPAATYIDMMKHNVTLIVNALK
ncbi:MAG TPA: metal ABC transporter substrate-binding protein [Anaerolineales bacterium]|nr:metal ABC transporter substrate-binding protein [Anaerolineales bacterium]